MNNESITSESEDYRMLARKPSKSVSEGKMVRGKRSLANNMDDSSDNEFENMSSIQENSAQVPKGNSFMKYFGESFQTLKNKNKQQTKTNGLFDGIGEEEQMMDNFNPNLGSAGLNMPQGMLNRMQQPNILDQLPDNFEGALPDRFLPNLPNLNGAQGMGQIPQMPMMGQQMPMMEQGMSQMMDQGMPQMMDQGMSQMMDQGMNGQLPSLPQMNAFGNMPQTSFNPIGQYGGSKLPQLPNLFGDNMEMEEENYNDMIGDHQRGGNKTRKSKRDNFFF